MSPLRDQVPPQQKKINKKTPTSTQQYPAPTASPATPCMSSRQSPPTQQWYNFFHPICTALFCPTHVFCSKWFPRLQHYVWKETLDNLLVRYNSAIWWTAVSNELGRPSNGFNGCFRATKAINFIIKYKVPTGIKVTYEHFVCDHQPLKSEPCQVRLNVGGDRLYCLDNTTYPAASILGKTNWTSSSLMLAKKLASYCVL